MVPVQVQSRFKPGWDVKTYSDHRVAMTAMALASLVGATIEGEGCIGVLHPSQFPPDADGDLILSHEDI